MKPVVTLGESLIDFVAGETGNLNEVRLFEKAAGGAPANVAACVARLGGAAAFIGKRGADVFGDFIADSLRNAGVDTAYFATTSMAQTGLAFVALDSFGDRSFAFYRDRAADMLLEPADIPLAYLREAGVLHVGSVSLAAEPVRSATRFAVKEAKKAGVVVSYDPNWRPALWPNEETGLREIRTLFPYADILKVNREEMVLLTGEVEPWSGAEAFHREGIALVLITLDANGCYYSFQPQNRGDSGLGQGGSAFAGHVPGLPIHAIDTTGAGDTFVGAFLYQGSMDEHTGWKPSHLRHDRVHAWVEFAVAASAFVTTKKGAIPALPTRAQVEAFQNRQP